MSTKQQERDALKKIEKLVESLGPNSYLAMAFEGCFQDARENIENDFGCSMKQRYERADADAVKAQQELVQARREIQALEFKVTELEKEYNTLLAKVPVADDLEDCISLAQERRSEYEQQMGEAAQQIVDHADAADSEEFQQAVRDHRNAKRGYDYTQSLIRRLTTARDAGAQ